MDGWRDRLAFTARAEWRRYRRRPWLLGVMVSTHLPMGPNTTTEIEWSMSAVDGLELRAAEKLWVVMTVSAFVQGAALLIINDGAADDAEPQAFEGNYPGLTESLESIGANTLQRLTSELTEPPDLDAWFTFGLQRTLDGVQLFIDGRNTSG